MFKKYLPGFDGFSGDYSSFKKLLEQGVTKLQADNWAQLHERLSLSLSHYWKWLRVVISMRVLLGSYITITTIITLVLFKTTIKPVVVSSNGGKDDKRR